MTTLLNPSLAPQAPEPIDVAGPVSSRDILNTLFYYRGTAVKIALLIIAIGVTVALLLPPSYTARARLLTLAGAVYDQQASNGAPLNGSAAVSPVDVEVQILSSSELHREIVRRELGKSVSAEEMDRRITEFEKKLHVSKLETGGVIEVTYTDRDPAKAAAALKTLLNVYFEERATVLTSGRVQFLTGQRDKLRQQVDEANAQIEAYEKENGVVDVTGQINSAVALDGLLRQREAEAQAAEADSRRSVEVLQSAAKEVPREVELYSDNTEAARTVGNMEGDLFNLEAKRADLASRYMASSPFVKQADEQIAALQAAINKQKSDMTLARRTGYNTYKDTANDRLSQAQAALAGAAARRAVTQKQMAESQDRLTRLIAVNDTIARLTTQRDQLQETLKEFNTQLEQARVQENLANTSTTTNVRVLEDPAVPQHRGNPPLLFIAAAFAAAIVISFVSVVVMSSMRDTFLSPQDAERGLKLPVFLDVARRDAMDMPARRDYGRLIAALDSTPTGGLGKTVLLLTTRGEGKVNVVAQGLVAALEPRAPGKIALVRMEEDSAAPPEGTPLALQVAGADKKLSVGMNMTRTRLTNLMHELRSTFEYTVITAPPAGTWFESLELSTVADLTVLVIQAEETRKPVAYSVITQAGYIGGEIRGLAMTGRKFYIPAWLYRLALDRSSAN